MEGVDFYRMVAAQDNNTYTYADFELDIKAGSDTVTYLFEARQWNWLQRFARQWLGLFRKSQLLG